MTDFIYGSDLSYRALGEAEQSDSDFVKMTKGYGLTTAEILYHMPDYPDLLQTYIWQDYDLAPRFPTLKRFLDFWMNKLEGGLHSVQVAHNRLISPREFTAVNGSWELH